MVACRVLLGGALLLLAAATVVHPRTEEYALQTFAKRDEWADKRRQVIKRLRDIAGTLDNWKLGDDIANVAGSAMGVVGGGMFLGGLAFPPLAIPGLLMTLAGAGGRVGVSIAHVASVKELAREAQELCEMDAQLLNTFLEEAEAVIRERIAVGVTHTGIDVLQASVRVLRHTFITVPNAAGGTSLRALLPAAAVGPIRVLSTATAGIGMAFDVLSLINGASNIAKNESDELANKLREIANELEKELNTVENDIEQICHR